MNMGKNNRGIRQPRGSRGHRRPACVVQTITGGTPVPPSSPRHGAALIVTLLVLVLLVVIVTGFLSTTRVEQMASRNYSYQNQAQQMAMIGVQQALAQLNTVATNLETADNFVSQPGCIMVTRGATTTNEFLYSSNAGSTNFIFLNEGTLIHTNTNTGIYKIPAITLETVSGSGTNTDTNTYGRYAYWVDDEGTKANLNAMTNNRSTFLVGNARPFAYSSIGTVGMDSGLTNFIGSINNSDASKPWPYFFTGNQIGFLTGIGIATARQYLHFMAGGSGNFLTNRITTLPFITNAIGLNTNANGFIANSAQPVSEIDSILSAKINRSALTNKFKGSFTSKYTQGVMRQIVANINDWPLPANATNGFTGSGDLNADGIPNNVLGLRSSIYLNEIVVSAYCATNANQIQPQVFIGFELVNPYGITWTNNSEVVTTVSAYQFTGTYQSGGSTISFSTNYSPNTIFTNAIPPIAANTQYYTNWAFEVGAAIVPLTTPCSNIVILTNSIKLKSVILRQSAGVPATVRDWAADADLPQWDLAPTMISAPIGMASAVPSGANVRSIAKNDPRVRTFPNYTPPSPAWTNVAGPNTTMGANNTGVVNFASGTGIATLTNDPSGGAAAPDIFSHPSFKKAFTTNGAYSTVMELGRVHTGLQWRTLQMRKQNSGETNPPDWALLDAFYVTNGVPKLNINSIPYHTNVALVTNSDLLRTRAVASLLAGGVNTPPAAQFDSASAIAAANVTNIASNIVTNKFSAASGWPAKRNANTNYFKANAFSSIGEVLEISDVSDFTAATNNDLIAEGRAASFIDAISVASDVFVIYSVGQALAPKDAQNAVAEYRCRALVRYDHNAKKFVIQMVEPMPFP